MSSSVIKVYYWPLLARGASLVRMLEHTGTPYEYLSGMPSFTNVCSVWEGEGDTLAPPVLVDGDFSISQSTATCFYLGKKLGLTPPDFNEFKAMQYLVDIVDVFEGNLGKNNEHGPTLKKFLEGSRWPKLMSNLERSIKVLLVLCYTKRSMLCHCISSYCVFHNLLAVSYTHLTLPTIYSV